MSDTPKKSTTPANVGEEEAFKLLQENLYREELLRQANQNKGSKYKPFNIEPFHYDRERLSGAYTDADRELRKQWLQDQMLSSKEPIKTAQVYPMNIFRRIYQKPFNFVMDALAPVLSPNATALGRMLAPKAGLMLVVSWYMLYWMKYDNQRWTSAFEGIYWYNPTRPTEFPDQIKKETAQREKGDFGDKEFNLRKVFLGDKFRTSTEISWSH